MKTPNPNPQPSTDRPSDTGPTAETAAPSTAAARTAARLAPLVAGLGLTEAELIALAIDLLEELLDDNAEAVRARVEAVKSARQQGLSEHQGARRSGRLDVLR